MSLLAAWLPVALWTLLIWTLSGDDFSAQSTLRFLDPLLRWLLPGIGEEGLAAVHFAVRKSAHAVEYGVLALLAFRAWHASLRAAPVAIAGLALAWVVVVAVADESRQAGSAARTGAAGDVAIDVAGGSAALALVLLVRHRAVRTNRGRDRG